MTRPELLSIAAATAVGLALTGLTAALVALRHDCAGCALGDEWGRCLAFGGSE